MGHGVGGLTMTTNNHPAHGPVSFDRLHQISETLSKAAAQSDGGNLGYAMADAVKVIDGVLSIPVILPCPVHLDPGLKFGKGVRTQCMLDALRRRADYYSELEAMTPEQRAEHDAGIAEFKAMLGNGSRGDMVDNVTQHAIHTAPTLDSDGKSAFPQRAMQSFGNSEQLIKHPSSNQGSDSNASAGEIKQPASNAEKLNQPVSDAYKLPSQASNEVNDAAWKLHDMLTEHGPLNGHQFNNLKGCFYEALKVAMRNPPAIQDGWIPVSERMPEDRDSVLLWDADLDDACSGHYSHQTGNFYQAGMIIDNEITHWMELPAAPQQEVK